MGNFRGATVFAVWFAEVWMVSYIRLVRKLQRISAEPISRDNLVRTVKTSGREESTGAARSAKVLDAFKR